MKRYLVIYLLYILEENKFLGSLKSELFNKIDRVARFHGGTSGSNDGKPR